MQFPPEFQAVLEARQDDYASSSKLQRPMVALEILQAWRSLTPPGRLLRYNTETRLYDDVGDKQAREKIASLLKRQKSVGIHKKREEVGSLQQNAERSSADALPLPVHDDTEMVETSSPSFSSAALSSSLKVPDKKTMLRRVSTQVNYAKKGILYGRQQEQQDIRDIYTSLGSRERDEACHLILLSGQAGVGKSALADSLKETVFKDGGLFVQGKYEQIDDTTRPLSAFQVALSELTVQLVACGEDDGKLALLRSEIRQSLGGESLLLQSLIPSLEQLLGPSPHGSSEQESSKAREIEKEAMTVKRLEFACRMFLRSVSHHYSLVLLLDDLQWADPASLKLLVSLVSDRKVSRMLFLGTHRDGQSSDLCLLNEALVAIRRISTTRVHEIELANLGVADVAGLLADALSIEEEKVTSLSSHLHSATDGNALFLLELFRSLQDDGLVEYDDATSQWTCDSHLIMSTLGSHNVSDFFRGRLLGMPEETQAILVKASCFGSRLDRYLLSLLVNHSNLDYHLVQAAKRGLLTVGESSGEYSFSHDKVQQAAYHMISPSELASFHYHMGRKLLRKLSEADRLDEYVSTVVSQLVKGASKISEDRDRHVVASLCITAGTMAAGTKGFQSASIHFLHGIDILGDRRWTYHYDLCLQLHNLAAEACYCIGEFEQLDELVDETLRHSRFFDDSLQARSTQVYSFSSRGMYTEALETGLATLSDLGEVIPSHPSTMRIIACVTITKRALRKKTNLQILRLHSIVEPRKIAAMQILNLMLISCVYARPALMPVVVCRMVQLTMKHGLCAVSCVGFGWYGLLLSG
jgi:predicted ATPase